MTKGSPEEVPTNYALIKVVENCKKHVKDTVFDTNILLAKKAKMVETLAECNPLLASVNDDLAQIATNIMSDCKAIECSKRLLRAEANLEKAIDDLNFWRNGYGKLLLLENFNSPKEFLEEIWSLLNEGKPVFGKSTIEGVMKYTKLRKDRTVIRGIEIPALSLSEVDDKKATIVKFSDLKSCIRADKLCLYLEGDKGWDSFSAVESPLLPFYTTLFIGETGATFKGVNVVRGERGLYYSVPHYLRDGVPSSGPVGYLSNSKEERDVEKDKELFKFITLAGDWKGAMEVVCGRLSSIFFHVIGKRSGGNGFLSSSGSISDCGIILRL